jgi:hypothetical protein
MKRKLKIDDLAVESFSTGKDDLARTRGTVRGASGYTNCGLTLIEESCASPCPIETHETCYRTCLDTCGVKCETRDASCVRGTC